VGVEKFEWSQPVYEIGVRGVGVHVWPFDAWADGVCDFLASSRDMDMQTPVYGNRQAVSAGKQVQAGSIKGERPQFGLRLEHAWIIF
jgi:hypothetical protein